MNASLKGNVLTIGDQNQVVPLTFSDRKSESRIRARLTSSAGRALPVRIAGATPADVQGHDLNAALQSVWLSLQLEGDDTEGHAISVRFPTAEDAEKFRRNLLMAGVLVGSLVIGSAGAIALTSNPATPDVIAPVEQSQVYQPQALPGAGLSDINPATGKPWRSGFQVSAEGELGGAADAGLPAAPAIERPAGRGPLETAE